MRNYCVLFEDEKEIVCNIENICQSCGNCKQIVCSLCRCCGTGYSSYAYMHIIVLAELLEHMKKKYGEVFLRCCNVILRPLAVSAKMTH